MKGGSPGLSPEPLTFISARGKIFNQKYTISPPSQACRQAFPGPGILKFLLNGRPVCTEKTSI